MPRQTTDRVDAFVMVAVKKPRQKKPKKIKLPNGGLHGDEKKLTFWTLAQKSKVLINSGVFDEFDKIYTDIGKSKDINKIAELFDQIMFLLYATLNEANVSGKGASKDLTSKLLSDACAYALKVELERRGITLPVYREASVIFASTCDIACKSNFVNADVSVIVQFVINDKKVNVPLVIMEGKAYLDKTMFHRIDYEELKLAIFSPQTSVYGIVEDEARKICAKCDSKRIKVLRNQKRVRDRTRGNPIYAHIFTDAIKQMADDVERLIAKGSMTVHFGGKEIVVPITQP